MALPETGPISLGLVRTELKRSDRISLGDADIRSLASIPSGMISLSDLRGKSAEVSYENTVNLTQANIHMLMGSPTEAGNYIFENTATISAASSGGWALQTGVFPEGSTLTIINRGHIRGGGGNGGNPNTGVGGAGGTALILNFPTAINNASGTIWGGGGGGGGDYGYGKFVGSTVTVTSGGGGGAGIPGGSGGNSGSGSIRNPGGVGTATTGGGGGAVGGTPGAAGGSGSGGGGRGGYSVQTNGNAVTWIDGGDRRGSVV